MARIVVLFNDDGAADLPGAEARADVLNVAEAMARALRDRGHHVESVAVSEAPLDVLERLADSSPDLVVNLCESLDGDARAESVVPAFLEALGIDYTGSGALALGVALHKPVAKQLLRASGVPTPEACLVDRIEALATFDLPFPVIVKPSREDASVGIDFDSVCDDHESLRRAVSRVLADHRQPALVERYIDGREIYVPLLEHPAGAALPMTEVSFGPSFEGRPRIVNYAAKWLENAPEYRDTATAPARLEPVLEARVRAVARAAFEALGCRDYGRVDLRVTDAGEPFVIEVNPNCDLHPEAGFAKAARAAGLDYPALAACLVETALARARSRAAMQIRPILPNDVASLGNLVSRIENFAPDEKAVALELIEAAATPHHPDYRSLVADSDRGLGGYVLFGPTPMTQGTFDLYWIATDPAFRGEGVGAALCRAMEAELRAQGGRLVRVETSSTEAYGGTQKFYDATGYLEEARVRDFYKPGDDLIIYAKRL